MRSRIHTLPLAAFAFAGLALAALPSHAAAQQDQRQFSGYIPGRCAVASRVIDGINRHDRRDTTRFTPERDTLFSATTASIRTCEAAYGGATTEPTEVLNLARVQLLTAQDEAAIATARRHLGTTASRPAGERAWELYLVVSDNLAGKPARIDEARKALAELDALGKPAAGVRTVAHAMMAGAAIQRYDDATMRTETDAVIKAWKELDEEGRMWRAGVLANALVARANAEALASGGDAARAVIDTARGIVPPAAVQARALVDGAQRTLGNIDKKGAQLEARFWYNVGPAGTALPAPGRVSLIVPIYRPCTGGCLSMMDGMRRITRQFANQDLDVTFRTRTYGFYLDTAPAAPLAEAQYDSAYFLGDVKPPGAIAIAETKYSWKPDGRRTNEPTTDDQNHPGAGVLLVDRKGIVRYAAGGWNSVFEARITELIGRLLAETAASP